MKILVTVFCFVLSIGCIQGQPSAETGDNQFQINTIEFVENDSKKSIQISITNKGAFFSYPVVQVKVDKKIIANKEGIFFLYGMVETEQFILETDMQPKDGTELTILIGSSNLSNPHVLKYTYSSKPK
jgi:hypothetical protein